MGRRAVHGQAPRRTARRRGQRMRPDTGALVVWFALLPLVSSLILNVLRDRLPDAAISAIFGFVLVGALWLERQRIAWRRLQQLDEQRDREQRAVIAHVENLRRD